MPLGAQIPKVIQSAPGQLVNYSFVDIAAGTGYATYYAGTASGANVLSNNNFPSNDINTNALISSSNVSGRTKIIDLDFDVLFNLPQDIRGDAIVEIPMGLHIVAGSANSSYYVNCKIRKWDGTTETDIASGTTKDWYCTTNDVGAGKYSMRTAKIIVPHTHFKKGEYLRLTVEGWAKSATINVVRAVVAHDPLNRSFQDAEDYNKFLASGASILKLQLPIRIDT